MPGHTLVAAHIPGQPRATTVVLRAIGHLAVIASCKLHDVDCHCKSLRIPPLSSQDDAGQEKLSAFDQCPQSLSSASLRGRCIALSQHALQASNSAGADAAAFTCLRPRSQELRVEHFRSQEKVLRVVRAVIRILTTSS